jgi:DNA-cytosine methyltransferase
VILKADIFDLSSKRLLRAARLKKGAVGLIIGGPPCQPFSLAGEREGFSDHRGLLIAEFLRVVADTEPLGVIFENVKGIRTTQEGAALKYVEQRLQELGYNTTECLLNAADYGVPQVRERVFVLATRKPYALELPQTTHQKPTKPPDLFDFDKPPYVTVADALSDLPPAYESSDAARRTAGTIEDRKRRQDYRKLLKRKFALPTSSQRRIRPLERALRKLRISNHLSPELAATCILALRANSRRAGDGLSIDEMLSFVGEVLGAEFPERMREAYYVSAVRPLLLAGLLERIDSANGSLGRFRLKPSSRILI